MSAIEIREPLRAAVAKFRELAALELTAGERLELLAEGGGELLAAALAVIDGLDEENRDAELPLLKAEVETLAKELADQFDAPLAVRIGIRYGVGPALEALTDVGERASALVREYGLPPLVQLHEGLGKIVAQLEKI